MRLSSAARKWIATLAGLSLVCFYASFFFSFGPNQMTSPQGEDVVLWVDATSAHLQAALEPLLRLSDQAQPDLEGRGDGAEHARRESSLRFFYSIPAAVAWWILFVMPLALRSRLRKAEVDGLTRRARLSVAALGLVSLIAAALKGLDYYREATTYAGFFHLGYGAYLLTAAFTLSGLMLASFGAASGRFLRTHTEG